MKEFGLVMKIILGIVFAVLFCAICWPGLITFIALIKG